MLSSMNFSKRKQKAKRARFLFSFEKLRVSSESKMSLVLLRSSKLSSPRAHVAGTLTRWMSWRPNISLLNGGRGEQSQS